MKRRHAMPFGAQFTDDRQIRFRLWAPAARHVSLCLEDSPKEFRLPMEAETDGWWTIVTERAHHGTLYRFEIDGALRVPDPASRFQPHDVHGPSEVIDPLRFQWADGNWNGRPWTEVVLYELHVGTFTPEGTFAGVGNRLDELVDLGITAIELMPIADFPGRRNWGYDGVLPYAPDSRYGRPDDLKQLVQAAHGKGLMVFLDVVYNHFGPEGNYLHAYAPNFFTHRHHTPWGDAINFDGPDSAPVRSFFVHNALYWMEEYGIDGLRLDAVHAILDDSRPDILTDIARTVRRTIDQRRSVHLVLENDRNAAHYLQPDSAGAALWYDAQWNDDIHHVLHVLTTGEKAGYYLDYADRPMTHLGRCLTEGFAYQGEASRYRGGQPRGERSAALPAQAFVSFIQNHDQIGNRAFGERLTLLTTPLALRAVSALLLLAPFPPLLFMGQEWGTAVPFPFFCDFGPDFAAKVANGRRQEFASFPEFRNAEALQRIPDPSAERTFRSAVLDWAERATAHGRRWLAFHRHLLAVRSAEIVPRLSNIRSGARYTLHGHRGLTVFWPVDGDSVLELRANLGPEECTCDALPAGRLLFNTHPAREDGRLLPWSVSWLLND